MSAATPFPEKPVDRILGLLDGVKSKGINKGWMALCPAHADRDPSLSVDENKAGDVLLHCFAGCTTDAILSALSREPADLFADQIKPREQIRFTSSGSRIVDTTDFHDSDGTVMFQEVRYEPKAFRQRRPDDRGGWTYNLDGIEPVLYGVPTLQANPGRAVVLLEGPKDAKRAEALGLLATTNPMGAGNWRPSYTEELRGRAVTIVVDNDKAGWDHGNKVAGDLTSAGCTVRIGAMPGVGEKGDFSDWVDDDPEHRTKAQAVDAFKQFPIWTGDTSADPAPSPDTVTLKVPPFPVEIFPEASRAYTVSQAKCIGVPVEMVAMPLMAFFGSIIGNRLYIKLKSGFHQYASLFLAIIAPPGAAKSPALAAARWPLDKLQTEAHTHYKRLLVQFEAETERWQAKPKDGRGDKPVRPKLRHFYTTDITIEALVSVLETAPGVAIIRDELLGWITSMDQYRGGKGSDRQQYLSLWAVTPIKADRRIGEPIYQTHPVASIVGGIQDDFLRDLHDKNGRRDGLIERLLLIRPDITSSGWTEDELDPELLDHIVELFREVDRVLSPADTGADAEAGRGLQLSLDARRLWIDWYNENDALKGETAGLRHGFYSKLPLQVARFALILNAMWNPDDPQRIVSKERMADAIELGEYVRAHFDRTLPLIGDVSPGHAGGAEGRVLRVLRIEGERTTDGWVSRRTILQKLGNVKADDLTAALDHLAEVGTVESRQEITLTKPREEWRLMGTTPETDTDTGESPNSSHCSTEEDEEVVF